MMIDEYSNVQSLRAGIAQPSMFIGSAVHVDPVATSNLRYLVDFDHFSTHRNLKVGDFRSVLTVLINLYK